MSAFDEQSPPVLALRNETGTFCLDIGASNKSIDAVLSQIQDEYNKVIAYAFEQERAEILCLSESATRGRLLYEALQAVPLDSSLHYAYILISCFLA